MRIAFIDRVEQRECANEEIVSRRSQPRSESDQALNGFLESHAPNMLGIEHSGQPVLENRDAWAGDARQRRLTPGRLMNGGDVARKAFFWCIDCGAPCEGSAGIDQPDRRRADGPRRRTPRFTLVKGQPNGIADHDMPVADRSRMPRLQLEIR